jgi:hypothetical protein
MNWAKKVATSCAGVAAVISLGAAPAAHAETMLGGVDVNAWCKSFVGATELSGIRYDPSNAYSWRCTYLDLSWRDVDMNAACDLQYGGGAYSRPLNKHDARSWRCFRG